ncbi:Fic family protein [Pseudactinotalea terrae]|uniref:Fic family protein n=1 Tax=Pseudactinotalea terrae TaxID=1743262 RepID=UPI0012E1DD34|nr:Fic family protein [Pseudactinotalea terrae]
MFSVVTVPAVTGEPQVWTSTRTGLQAPYLAAVVAPLAGIELDLPTVVTARLCHASVTLARATARSVLHRPLALAEAMASSRIEGVVADALDVGLTQLGRRTGPAARLTAAAATATDIAAGAVAPLDDLALTCHLALLGTDPAWAGRAGVWRTQQVWIGRPGSTPATAAFVPPRAAHVPAAMSDLARFADRDDIPALALAALVHAQLETIHPFGDGNGRVGRALVQTTLARAGIIGPGPVPLSVGLLADAGGYIEALRAFRDGDVTPIVDAFTQAAASAAATIEHLEPDLTAHLDAARDRLTATVRPQAAAWRVLDLLPEHPVLDAPTVRRLTGLTGAAPHRALDQLARAGVLTEVTASARNRVWVHDGVLASIERAVAVHRW